jgi:CRP-like cAMP-binding protein
MHRGDVIFAQGDPCDTVMYLRNGTVNPSLLTVVVHD